MAELIVGKDESLTSVVVATAYYPDFSKKVRHERHVHALRNSSVTVLLGHYVRETITCNECDREWRKPTEKEGDINIALALLDGAYRNDFDTAYLVTADTDHVATVKLVRKRFPAKRIITVSPPGRPHSQELLACANGKAVLTEDIMDLSVFPKVVPGTGGRAAVVCPFEYDPPAGWVHPNDRP